MQLNSAEIGKYKELGFYMEEYDASTMGATKNYVITYTDGQTEKTALTPNQFKSYQQDLANGLISNIEVATATSTADEIGVLVRPKNAPPNTSFTYQTTTQNGLTDLINNDTLEVVPIKDAGSVYEVIDKQTNKLTKVPAIQYFSNADRYQIKRGLTGSFTTANGDVFSFDSSGQGFSSMNPNSTGKAVEKVVEQVRSRKFLTNEVTRLGNNIINLVESQENPDLLFNNFAATGIDFAKKIGTIWSSR